MSIDVSLKKEREIFERGELDWIPEECRGIEKLNHKMAAIQAKKLFEMREPILRDLKMKMFKTQQEYENMP